MVDGHFHGVRHLLLGLIVDQSRKKGKDDVAPGEIPRVVIELVEKDLRESRVARTPSVYVFPERKGEKRSVSGNGDGEEVSSVNAESEEIKVEKTLSLSLTQLKALLADGGHLEAVSGGSQPPRMVAVAGQAVPLQRGR